MKRALTTRTGAEIPLLGQGTWNLGEDPARRREEISSLRLGFDLGMSLVDTAEMYGDGGAEEVVGEAISGRQDDIFVVSKVLPHNATREGTVRAAERSLKRLGIDCLDLYLLHWSSEHPLQEILDAFQVLVAQGKIRYYGVSNFDLGDMEQALALAGGEGIAVNQVLYNLHRRGAERRLLPWCQERGIGVMAYAPLDQGRLCDARVLKSVGARRSATPGQVALAWTLRREGIISIPKASDPQHVHENAEALDVKLTADDLAELDAVLPQPQEDIPLEMI